MPIYGANMLDLRYVLALPEGNETEQYVRHHAAAVRVPLLLLYPCPVQYVYLHLTAPGFGSVHGTPPRDHEPENYVMKYIFWNKN